MKNILTLISIVLSLAFTTKAFAGGESSGNSGVGGSGGKIMIVSAPDKPDDL